MFVRVESKITVIVDIEPMTSQTLENWTLTRMTSDNFESISRLEFCSDGEGHKCGIIDCVEVAAA